VVGHNSHVVRDNGRNSVPSPREEVSVAMSRGKPRLFTGGRRLGKEKSDAKYSNIMQGRKGGQHNIMAEHQRKRGGHRLPRSWNLSVFGTKKVRFRGRGGKKRLFNLLKGAGTLQKGLSRGRKGGRLVGEIFVGKGPILNKSTWGPRREKGEKRLQLGGKRGSYKSNPGKTKKGRNIRAQARATRN